MAVSPTRAISTSRSVPGRGAGLDMIAVINVLMGLVGSGHVDLLDCYVRQLRECCGCNNC